MRHLRGTLAACGFVCLVSLAGCSEPDTVLLVLIDGATSTQPIYQFQIEISVGQETRSFQLPETLRSTPLPASFTVRVPRDHEGPLRITIVAHDQMAREIGRGSALFDAFDVGGINEATITLQPTATSS
jgi:hypothetical protein